MATDIAFAVGVLALLGKRVAAALRILLLALAVIDDVGAILVIAFFYAVGFSVTGLAVAATGVAIIFAIQKIGVRSPWAYVIPGIVVWAGVLAAGVHPTLAGVIVGLMTPARAWFGARRCWPRDGDGPLPFPDCRRRLTVPRPRSAK
jgi:Na+:H+ antiporter, NhaA family